MFGCGECFCWDTATSIDELYSPEPKPFSLPAPIPKWPEGQGFATQSISLGEIEVIQITQFESIWSTNLHQGKVKGKGKRKAKGFTFYRPIGIPDDFYCLGHYCQPNDQPLRGYVLVARAANDQKYEIAGTHDLKSDFPALRKPLNYCLVVNAESEHNGDCYFWLPNPPEGYKSVGIVVTNKSEEPNVDEVRCVRADLTERCVTSDLIFSLDSKTSFRVWNTKPRRRGMCAEGVSVGTFYCSNYLISEEVLPDVACLKNLDQSLCAMPNLDQIHALIKHYGPTVFFHPDEGYLPSSVQWFFKNGALLYKDGKQKGKPIDCSGSKLPGGGENDRTYWIDLPADNATRNRVKRGDLESAELYVHVKPAQGGTFTDIAMWIFCPFNGPATLKIGLVTVPMSKIGEHVSDWEHYTLRVSNFTGELWQVFFSEHSGGRWVDAPELEFVEGNRPVVYSSKHGHASFPHAGTYLQGSSKLGIGLRNDTAHSKHYVNSSIKYQLVAAEHLGDVVTEPCWLQFMREWGPTVVYDSRNEVDKIISLLPFFIRFTVEDLFDLFPTELYGEEGPTGPKEKDNWLGDEIC